MTGPISASARLAPVRWTRYVGAWLGIGSSPAALVLGAQLADHGAGALPMLWLLCGVAIMVALLVLQGQLGLRPPMGHGKTFVALSREYLSAPARTAVGVLIAAGMVGWVGFGAGIGGESLGRVTGVPQPACTIALGLLILVLALRDMQFWNKVAIGTTLLTLLVAPLLLLGLDRVELPVTTTTASGPPATVLLAAFVGYVAVFMLRSPDFTAGLATRWGLLACVAALVLPALALSLIGAAVHLSGDTGEEASLAAVAAVRLGDVRVGDLLVVVAVLAPAVTAAFSGGLALRAFTGVPARVATSVIAVLGLLFGLAELHRELVGWLALLAGIGPPIAVPFWVEAARRRRGRSARRIPAGVWVPPALCGAVLMVGGVPGAALVALGVALVVSGGWGLAGVQDGAAAASGVQR